MKKHLQIFLTLVVVVLLGALIIQNRDPVQTKLLFISVEMPLVLLLALTSGLGFVLGLLITYTGIIKAKP